MQFTLHGDQCSQQLPSNMIYRAQPNPKKDREIPPEDKKRRGKAVLDTNMRQVACKASAGEIDAARLPRGQQQDQRQSDWPSRAPVETNRRQVIMVEPWSCLESWFRLRMRMGEACEEVRGCLLGCSLADEPVARTRLAVGKAIRKAID